MSHVSFADAVQPSFAGNRLGSRQDFPAVWPLPRTLDARVLPGQAIQAIQALAPSYVSQHSCTHAAQKQSQAFEAPLRSIAFAAERVMAEMDYGTLAVIRRMDLGLISSLVDPTHAAPYLGSALYLRLNILAG